MPDERNVTEPGRGAPRHRTGPRSEGEARRGRRPLRAVLLDRPPRGAEDQAGPARRVRERVHGQRPAVRRPLGLVRARALPGRRRPDSGARSGHPRRLPLGPRLRVGVRGPLVGGCAVQPVSPPCPQARGARRGSEGIRGVRGHRARVHRHALGGREAGQGVRRRSAPRRGRAPAAPGVRLRRRVLDRFDGVSRLAHRHPRRARLGLEGRSGGGSLLAVRARLRLHRRPAHGRPPGVPARAAEGDRQEARHVHHLHAQAHHRRLALRRAHQLLDAAGRRPGGESLRGSRRRLGKRRLPRGRRAASPRRRADRRRLLDGQFVQRPRAPGRRVRGRHGNLGPRPT